MRTAQLALALLALAACDVGEPDRDVVDLSTSGDNATAQDDASSPAPSGGGSTPPSTGPGPSAGDSGAGRPLPGRVGNAGGGDGVGSGLDASTDPPLGQPPVGDASLPQVPGDDAGFLGTSSPFACTRDSDCVVRDVGNCCGFYPRCANINATFTPPSCSGVQVGVCGFPTIARCECRQSTCLSVEAGPITP